MALFQSQPGKCCYWENGPTIGDADRTPCEPFKTNKRGKSDYWVHGINLNKSIYSNIYIDRKPLYYVLHIFKHVESVGLDCNNETELNEYLKELIDNNKTELNKLLQAPIGSNVILCLKDSKKNNILLMVTSRYIYGKKSYLIYHLSKRTDDTCDIGNWETGVDNYDVPEIDKEVNPMQYKLFKTEQMEKEDREAIIELLNSPVVGSIPVKQGSPESVVELHQSAMQPASHLSALETTLVSLKNDITDVQRNLNQLKNKNDKLQKKIDGKKGLNSDKFLKQIEKDENGKMANEIIMRNLKDNEREIEIEIDKIEREIEIEIDKIERERALNPNSPTAAKGRPRGKRSPEKGPPLPPATVDTRNGVRATAAAPIPTPTPTPVWSPKNPPTSNGGTKKRIKKRKTKKRKTKKHKTKSKKTKRKH